VTKGLSKGELRAEVCRALKAEGCPRLDVEIVRLLGAAPKQRNWELATVGPAPTLPWVHRCIAAVQIRLGEKFHLLRS
jgi:hypothetical protein